MLGICILGFMVGILFLIIALITLIVCIVDQDIDTSGASLLGVCGIGGVLMLILGICTCIIRIF